MRSLAYIETIKALKPIANADQIECAEVLGWEVVIRKGEFKVGDFCIYVEIDSKLPEGFPCFEFLRPKKFRIKTVRLKQQISQGIVFPINILTQVNPGYDVSNLKVGDDLTDVLKITKYSPDEDEDNSNQHKKSWLANKWSYVKWKLFGIKPVKKGSFPSDCPRTDEVRVQKMGSELEKREGQLVYIAEKLEGSSSTFIYRRSGNLLGRLFGQSYIFQICSRNRIVYNSRSGGQSSHYLIDLADRLNILPAMKRLDRNIAVQGESIGPKIQKNVYKLPDVDFRVFSIYDLNAKKYLSFLDALATTDSLGLKFVPIISSNTKLINDVKYYVEASKGNSFINPQVVREGIVIRTIDSSFSFKSINVDYLLKQE